MFHGPGPGAPSKCTPEVIERAAKYIRMGATYDAVAKQVGISEPTWRAWRKRGAEGEEPYATFAAAIDRAESDLFIAMSWSVVKAGQDDPKFALEFLQRRQAKHWSLTHKSEVSGPDGGPIEVTGPRVMLPPERDDE